jgi:hypothetical protein
LARAQHQAIRIAVRDYPAQWPQCSTTRSRLRLLCSDD